MSTVAISFENLPAEFLYQGQMVDAVAHIKEPGTSHWTYHWSARCGTSQVNMQPSGEPNRATFDAAGVEPGVYEIRVTINAKGHSITSPSKLLEVRPAILGTRGSAPVTLGRSSSAETKDVALWQAIRQGASALAFDKYEDFVSTVMNGGAKLHGLNPQERDAFRNVSAGRGTPFPGIGNYQLLKTATEVFVMLSCRVLGDADFFDQSAVDDYNTRNDRNDSLGDFQRTWSQYLVQVNGKGPATMTLPYLALIRRRLGDKAILPEVPVEDVAVEAMDGILQQKLSRPCFSELIWSYWMEEGMLVQSLNAIAVRFQNQRTSERDPLGNFTIAPLHPISSVLFGYIQDEQHRLSLARRAYEYDHEYGFTLHGKAVPVLRAADSRSKFLEAFHNLLTACVVFYKQDDNTTIIADGFPVLNAVKEVHLLLAEGAHNQFGDLPTVARIEMLMQQWILARPEIRDFIGGRPMVPYAEPWMDRVDAMKKLQNWSDVTVTYFYDLARFGEQLLLSIRYGAWNDVFEPHAAVNWARDFRPEVKQYIHAYRAATGVDLGVEVVDPNAGDRLAPPSEHLRRRLEVQLAQRPASKPGNGAAPAGVATGRNGTGSAPVPSRRGNGHRPDSKSGTGSRPEMEFSEDY